MLSLAVAYRVGCLTTAVAPVLLPRQHPAGASGRQQRRLPAVLHRHRGLDQAALCVRAGHRGTHCPRGHHHPGLGQGAWSPLVVACCAVVTFAACRSCTARSGFGLWICEEEPPSRLVHVCFAWCAACASPAADLRRRDLHWLGAACVQLPVHLQVGPGCVQAGRSGTTSAPPSPLPPLPSAPPLCAAAYCCSRPVLLPHAWVDLRLCCFFIARWATTTGRPGTRALWTATTPRAPAPPSPA
jgi:hypothetical protein